ncbi:MAG: hypothetical protein NVSMB30_07510 [Hymenobacter sp.]
MRPLYLALLLGCLAGPAPALQARPRPQYAVDGNEPPVALLRTPAATYLVTQRSVFRLEGRQFVRKYQSADLIQCAAASDTALWLGTRQGVWALDTGGFRPKALPLPLPAATLNVVALFTDARGALWVGANGLGMFRWAQGTFTQELNTPSINAGLATADGSVWVATNIGLSRQQGHEWTRYNEEGVANHEIPDNVVEKLLPDNAGNLWVVMSEGLCVFEAPGRPQSAETELPAVKFLGRPGNEVFGVAYLPGTGHLFATAMGLLLLPTSPVHRFDELAPTGDKIEEKHLLVPLPALPGAAPAQVPRLLLVDPQRRVWLASAGGVTVRTTKQLAAFIRKHRAAQLPKGATI